MDEIKDALHRYETALCVACYAKTMEETREAVAMMDVRRRELFDRIEQEIGESK